MTAETIRLLCHVAQKVASDALQTNSCQLTDPLGLLT